jgi:ABC-2 type transport system permease protein
MRKEVRHLLRDRQTLLILLLLPLAQVVLFGFAVRTDIDNVRIGIVDPMPDPATRALRSRFEHNGRFEVVATPDRAGALDDLFRRGAADVGVTLPTHLARDLGRGDVAPIQIITDAADPNSGVIMQSYTAAIIRSWHAEQPSAGGVRLETRARMRFNPTLESVNLFVPGLIALILTMVTAMMTAISLSREKERGTFEVLLVSPLHPWQIILGKVLPYLGLALANVVSVLLAAHLVFQVPFVGSIALLLAASTLYAMVGLALGVLIAAVTSSQLAAMLGAVIGTMLPNLMLSGMIFPIASMPAPLRIISHVIPARWFITICRGIMLKGAGLAALWPDLAVLGLMFAVLIGLAVRRSSVRLA